MDKKTLIGLLLIGVILFGFSWYNSNQQAEFNRQKAIADSIAAANAPVVTTPAEDAALGQAADSSKGGAVTPTADTATEQQLGKALHAASQGSEEFYVVENDVMRLTFSNKGGRVASVELKGYKSYQGNPLVLFDSETSDFDLSFFLKYNFNNVQVNTNEYYFTPVNAAAVAFAESDPGDTKKSFSLRLPVDSAAYVEYLYTITKNNYKIDFDVRFVGMEQLVSANQRDLEITWANVSRQNEKGFDNENNYTTIAYNYPGEESIDDLGMSKENKEQTLNTKVKWVAFKQQFFSSIFVATNDFQNATIDYKTHQPGSGKVKDFHAKLSVPFSSQDKEYKFNFYFGPNKFSVLKTYGLHFERLVPLGWGIIGWVNRLLVIPTFDTLGKHIASFGLIILLLTIFVKILISPLTYKSFLSTAKMRLLKPEMDALNEKYPKPEDALKKQQATMALYKSAGVNPLGGCLPMLIQFPVLIAMFRFFPSSIELRGESFLWAEDLSSYDSILNLPFKIPFYGDHVSLFAILAAVAIFFSSRISYSQTSSAGPQMAGMKFMMLYMMPLMMLFFFNQYSSGLSYYFLLSNLFTVGQTYAFRYVVNEDKLHRKMKENAKKPQKKSKFQLRMEEMAKQQQQQAKKKK